MKKSAGFDRGGELVVVGREGGVFWQAVGRA